MMDYLILSGDIVVAKWVNNKIEIINEDLLPLFLKNTSNVENMNGYNLINKGVETLQCFCLLNT